MLLAVGAGALLAAASAHQDPAPGQLVLSPVAAASAAPSAAQAFFTDLIPAASDWYPEALRKTSHYDHSCHKPDHLSSVASLVSGFAKILLAVAALLLIKLLTIKMFFLPAKLMFLAKIGVKAMLLYPLVSKMVKLWKKKKKKKLSIEGRLPVSSGPAEECPERAACLISRAARGGWTSQLAALAGIAFDDLTGEDSSYLLALMETMSPDDVAYCMSYECEGMAF